MERAVALKKLRKLLGDKLGYRVNDNAPTHEQREAARAELKARQGAYDLLKEMREARYQAVLASDAEYQRLKTSCAEMRKHREELAGISSHYKITVGTSGSMFFTVKAEGDSWEEVIEKVEKAA